MKKLVTTAVLAAATVSMTGCLSNLDGLNRHFHVNSGPHPYTTEGSTAAANPQIAAQTSVRCTDTVTGTVFDTSMLTVLVTVMPETVRCTSTLPNGGAPVYTGPTYTSSTSMVRP